MHKFSLFVYLAFIIFVNGVQSLSLVENVGSGNGGGEIIEDGIIPKNDIGNETDLNSGPKKYNNPIENQLDLDTWTAPYYIRKGYPYFLAGYTNENLPIWGVEFGQWDLINITSTGGQALKDFNKYIDQVAYRIIESLKAKSTLDEPITDALALVDFDQFKLRQFAHLPSMRWLLYVLSRHRDLIETYIAAVVVVNANFVAESTINLVRPVLGNILERVEVYGTRRNLWLPHTRRKFDNQLPEYYGGAADFKPMKVYG